MSEINELLKFWDNEIIQTYNELYAVYKWQKDILVLLWIALRQALNWYTNQLLNFEDFLEENSRFHKNFLPIRDEVKSKTFNITTFSNWENAIEDFEDKTSSNRKVVLLNRLIHNLWFWNIWKYNSPKRIPYLLDHIASFLEYPRHMFIRQFPNISELILYMIPEWKIDFSKWLDYLINILFLLWWKENIILNLKNFDDFLKEHHEEIKETKSKVSEIRFLLIWVWIYVDSKIFREGDNLTEEEVLLLKSELEKRFWTDLLKLVIRDLEKPKDLTLDDIIVILEDLIYYEVVRVISNFSKKYWRFLSNNYYRKSDSDFHFEVIDFVMDIDKSIMRISVRDKYFWLDVLNFLNELYEDRRNKDILNTWFLQTFRKRLWLFRWK